MRFLQAHKLYPQLPMQAVSRLPDAGFGRRKIVLMEQRREGDLTDAERSFDVYCTPKPQPGQRWGHRVMVVCDCGKHVPFGRMGQHWGKRTCTAVEVK